MDQEDEAYMARMRAYVASLRAGRTAPKRKPRAPKTTPAVPPGAKPRGRPKITEDDVRAIRRRHAAGENRNDLARAYGITPRAVNLIAARKKWPHVT